MVIAFDRISLLNPTIMKTVFIVVTYYGYESFQLHGAFLKLKDAEEYYKKIYKGLSVKDKEWNNSNPHKNEQLRPVELNP